MASFSGSFIKGAKKSYTHLQLSFQFLAAYDSVS